MLVNESELYNTTVLMLSIRDNKKKILIKRGSQLLYLSEITAIKMTDLKFLLFYLILNKLQKLQHKVN